MGKLQGVEALDSVLKSELRALKISCFPEHVVSFGFFCCCWQLWHFILLPCSIFLFFFFGVIPNCIFHYATIGLSYETLHPVLVNPPTPSHVKLPFPYPPQCASCTHSFTLKRDTWTFRGWQRASSLQINRNTCGLWKWGFLCYCFTKWPLSPKFILFNASHPPATCNAHIFRLYHTDTTQLCFSIPERTHTSSHSTSHLCSLWNRWWCGGSDVCPSCLSCSQQINAQSYERLSCHHSASHSSPDTPATKHLLNLNP